MNKLAHGRVWLFVLLWLGLVGCIGNVGGESTAAAVKSPVPIVPTVQDAEVLVCRDLGCENSLNIQLTGNVPSTFVVEVNESSGIAIVGGCFPLPEDIQGVNPTREEIDPDDKEAINKLQTILGNIPLCSETNLASLEVYRRSDGTLYSLFAICSDLSVAQNNVLFSCARDSIASFLNFTPSQVSIKVYAGKETIAVEHTPYYTTFSHNDPQCTPTYQCQAATVMVNIP